MKADQERHKQKLAEEATPTRARRLQARKEVKADAANTEREQYICTIVEYNSESTHFTRGLRCDEILPVSRSHQPVSNVNVRTKLPTWPTQRRSSRRFFHPRIRYTVNCDATFNIETNPGPVKCPCVACGKPCKKNQRALRCDECDRWAHAKCSHISTAEYYRLSTTDTEWYCNACSLPFNFSDSFFEDLTQAHGLAPDSELDAPISTSASDVYQVLAEQLRMTGLKVAHLNVRGLITKLRELEILLQKSKLDILAITETHLTENILACEISIDGYKTARLDRKHKRGGGCILYHLEHLDIHEREDLTSDIEAVWIDVTTNSQKLLVGCIYRPPDDYEFYNKFYHTLEEIWRKRKNILILGDFNSNILANGTHDENYAGRRLLRILNSFDLRNMIKEPTRVTETSQTLIDLLITSDVTKIMKAGAIDPGLSDHSLIYGILKMKRNKSPPRLITAKNYKHVDITALKHDMESAPWSVIEAFDDIDDTAWAWETLYKSIINTHIPERKVKVRSDSKPWINSEIRKAMNKRYKLLKLAKDTKANDIWQEYKKKRNEVTSLLKKAEANYWKEEFKSSKCSKDFWKLVRKVTRKGKHTRIGPISDDKNNLITDDTMKAEAMNEYFTEIGRKLASETSPMPEHQDVHHFYRVTPTLSQVMMDKATVSKQLQRIKPGKAKGPDLVSPKDIKLLGNSTITGLHAVFKHSLLTSMVPAQWKISKMLNVHKKGDPTDRGNYRPLQMLSTPSKLLEGVICEEVDKFISKTNASNDHQWGFKKGTSTEELLIYLTETWKRAIDNRQVVGVVFIDFKKAFDTVSHSILEVKLQAMGLSGDLLEWLTNYLKDRKQFAVVNESNSQLKPANYGVPQGSLLGPRFFSFYVNDLPDAVNEGELDMYADDTTLFCIGQSIDSVTEALNRSLADVDRWCRNNQLTIHTGKTEAMMIVNKPFCGPLKPLTLGGRILSYVTESRCLGITIDSRLTWQAQAKLVCKSFSKKVSLIKRMKYLSKDTLQAIYFTSIIPAVMYCDIVWATGSPSIIQDIEHIHLRAAKIIHRLSENLTDNEILAKTNWQPLSNIYKRKILTLMHSVHRNKASEKITNLFKYNTSAHYNLRRTEQYLIPKYNLQIGRNSLSYRGAIAWNNLPNRIKQIEDRSHFKGVLKKNRKIIESINFNKETCLLTNKDPNFLY